MTREEILAEIIVLAVRHSETANVNGESRLAADLQLDGDDASEFLDAFSERFDIDWTGFHWLRYFGDEGFDPLQPTLAVAASILSPNFRRRWRRARNEEREITISHLCRVAEAGHWIESPLRRTRDKNNLKSTLAQIVLTALAALAVIVSAATLTLFGFVSFAIVRGDKVPSSFAAILTALAATKALLLWSSWNNINRKLASAEPAAR